LVFETRKIPLETLGEYLKAARATFNLSLEQVALSAKVNAKWLSALEEGKLELLPADVYIHGTLRRLAVFYNLDAGILLFQYNKERGISKHISEKNNKDKTMRKSHKNELKILPIIKKVLFFARKKEMW
jgi:cytoskeletal protein RodZ